MDETPVVPPPGGDFDRAAEASGGSPSSLGKQLRGELPCFGCRYNLKGVSIRGVCPECGTAVRATILAMVDPLAKELRPIHHPRVIAGLLSMWGLFSFLAALAAWLPYIPGLGAIDWRVVILATGMLSGAGAMCFVRPHAGIPIWHSVCAALAVLLYAPVVLLALELAGPRWIFAGLRYPPASAEPESARIMLRLMQGAGLVAMLLLIRPNARLLVARSLAIRTGRVDRQTILAMVVAAGVGATGDLLMLVSYRYLSVTRDTIHMAGIALVVAGAILLTLGAFGLMVDSLRIARAIATPRPNLRAIIHGPPLPQVRPPSDSSFS